MGRALRPATTRALPYLFRKVGDFAPNGDPMFKAFLDGQLLILAQTTAGKANALYGSAALDLPRRGVNHVRGGIGSLAKTLADWIRAIELCLPGTPVTFDFYTRRPRGMVGGFPQTSLFSARDPKTGITNLWLVGDSIFPGQSTAGVTLGAMRVAADVLETAGYRPRYQPVSAIPLAVGE